MATPVEQVGSSQEMTPAVVLAVSPAPSCGECAFHVPHVTKAGGWCACARGAFRWRPVAAQRAVCADFSEWPNVDSLSTSPAPPRL